MFTQNRLPTDDVMTDEHQLSFANVLSGFSGDRLLPGNVVMSNFVETRLPSLETASVHTLPSLDGVPVHTSPSLERMPIQTI